MALLIGLGVAVLAIVAHLLLQRRHAASLPPEPERGQAPRDDDDDDRSDGPRPPEPPFLVGRDALLDRLDELASTPAPEEGAGPRARAVALVGPPGIGKTALALAFAEETRPLGGESPDDDDFRDGRVSFELGASTTSPPADDVAHLALARAVLGREGAATVTPSALRDAVARHRDAGLPPPLAARDALLELRELRTRSEIN
jgi:hypothetical protein